MNNKHRITLILSAIVLISFIIFIGYNTLLNIQLQCYDYECIIEKDKSSCEVDISSINFHCHQSLCKFENEGLNKCYFHSGEICPDNTCYSKYEIYTIVSFIFEIVIFSGLSIFLGYHIYKYFKPQRNIYSLLYNNYKK